MCASGIEMIKKEVILCVLTGISDIQERRYVSWRVSYMHNLSECVYWRASDICKFTGCQIFPPYKAAKCVLTGKSSFCVNECVC